MRFREVRDDDDADDDDDDDDSVSRCRVSIDEHRHARPTDARDDDRRSSDGRVVTFPPDFVDARAVETSVEVVDLMSPEEARRRDGGGDDAETADASESESEIPPLRERLLGSRATASEASPSRRGEPKRGEPKRAKPSEAELADSLTMWMRADERTYESALLMRSIDVDEALARARAAGVRASRVDFVAWLETEGLAYSQTKKRRLAAARKGGR